MKMKSGKLDKLSMPSKKKPLDDVAVMELELEPTSDESDTEESAEEGEPEMSSALSDASDEELMAEVRKRGLASRAEKASSDEPMSDDEY